MDPGLTAIQQKNIARTNKHLKNLLFKVLLLFLISLILFNEPTDIVFLIK